MSAALEEHYSVSQVAELWGISITTVRRIFQNEPGVLHIALPRLLQRKHKPHVRLRIPASVVARLHEQWSAGASREVKAGRRVI